MTEAQGTELLQVAHNVYLAAQLLFILSCLCFGGILYVAGKGR